MKMKRERHAHREKNNDILKMCVNLKALMVQEMSGAEKQFGLTTLRHFKVMPASFLRGSFSELS